MCLSQGTLDTIYEMVDAAIAANGPLLMILGEPFRFDVLDERLDAMVARALDGLTTGRPMRIVRLREAR